MLFNSHIFIFGFLPIVLLGFYGIAQYSHNLAALWLASSSLFFYGWWDSRFVGLLLGSIIFNYSAGHLINRKVFQIKWMLIFSISVNLILLGYFKYSNFFIKTINQLIDTDLPIGSFFLPLGISFFTFTQIAFLVDSYQGKAKEYSFIHYTLFVTYFPHLIAGPVLHHKEMMPQFRKSSTYHFSYDNLMVGTCIFFIGLFKKLVIADSLSVYVNPVFTAPLLSSLTFIDAWVGALSYTFQLYFDFSGYSDMAIGLSRMFGVILPLNFHSPYKAFNIIEFWRRWHMTLSRLLRDYLYIPLGGSRNGNIRRYVNLMITMLLGGLWHGAGWTYILWGGLHGLYLVINHGWQSIRKYFGNDPKSPLSFSAHYLSVIITFIAVTLAWVVFRADNINIAITILKAMTGANGFLLPETWMTKWGWFGHWLSEQGINFGTKSLLAKNAAFTWILVSFLIVWMMPNTQQIMSSFNPAMDNPKDQISSRFLWKPSIYWLFASIVCTVVAILSISDLSEFIYFQF